MLELKCLIFILIGLIIKSLLHRQNNKKIWLIGENFGESLKDNGYCFFKFCHEKKRDQEVFFVTKTRFVKKDKFLVSNNRVLMYSSMSHIWNLINADVLLYSHTHRDVIFHKLFKLIKSGKKIIFLQHGVTAFKKFDSFYKKFCNEPDLVSVVSDFEKLIMSDHVGIEESRLKITGFPRYDYLYDKLDISNVKQIAYMPTWRDWQKENNFKSGVFFKRISELLNNKSLQEFLEKNNLILKFYLHKNMKDYIEFFHCGNNIKTIKFGQESVQEMLKNSQLLITDYSSVSWDFYYLQKPVIFYQFDLNDYQNNRGSYLDFKAESFGDIVDTEKELLDTIHFYFKNSFQEKEFFSHKRDKYFNYSDTNNCGRLYQAISEL